MAEELFNYPAEPPSQNSATSPRPKTSREASRKRRRRRHHSSNQNNESQKENQVQEEEDQQQERPLLPSIYKEKQSQQNLNQSNVKNNTANRNLNENENNFEEEEIDDVLYWIENGMKDPSILEKCNPDLLPTVIVNLKDLRDQYLVNDEVDESCAADAALTEARKIHKKNLMRIATKSLREELEARLQEAEDALRDLEDTCEYQEDRMNREMAKETADLINKHKLETQKLIATWTSQPPPQPTEQLEIDLGKTYSTRPKTSRRKKRPSNNPTEQNVNETDGQNNTENINEEEECNEDTARKFRQYNKYSAQLRYLYDQADRLLRAKKYQESKAVQKKARELEKIEVQQNHLRMERDYNAAMEALQVKQADEMAIQEKTHNDRRNEYYHAKEFDMTVAKNRIEKIKKELEAAENPDKVWALHHRHDSEMPRPDNQSPTQTQRSVYSSRGVFETTTATSTIGKEPVYNKFNRINLPPLKSGRSSRRVVEKTQRSFKFNNGYVFT